MDDRVNLIAPASSSRVKTISSRRWPTLYWLTLKILSVFHYEDLVTDRKCFACEFKDLSERRGMDENATKEDLDLNYLLLMYESKSNGGVGINNNRQPCEVCDTMWWNFQGKTERYTAHEIGASVWNHKGSGALSLCVLLLTITALVYEMSFYVSVMWAKPAQTLSLLNRFTIFVFLILHSLFCLASKLRSTLCRAVPNLSWATTLNARFIIKRAQLLDLPRKGLPGKAFFFACMMWPLFNSMFRSYIYLFLNECVVGLHAFATSVVAILFMQTWGFFMYLLYFIRMSFQRNMTLLISFLNEHEGQVDKCRGVLASVAVDFFCYSKLCGLYTLLMVPIGFLALTTNITFDYILGDKCTRPHEDSHSTDTALLGKLMSWSEMAMAWFLTLIAMGGLQVTYMWDELSTKFMHLRSDRYHHFWKNLSLDVSSLGRRSNSFLATTVSTLIAIYMGLNLGSNQDISIITKSCLDQNSTLSCP